MIGVERETPLQHFHVFFTRLQFVYLSNTATGSTCSTNILCIVLTEHGSICRLIINLQMVIIWTQNSIKHSRFPGLLWGTNASQQKCSAHFHTFLYSYSTWKLLYTYGNKYKQNNEYMNFWPGVHFQIKCTSRTRFIFKDTSDKVRFWILNFYSLKLNSTEHC